MAYIPLIHMPVSGQVALEITKLTNEFLHEIFNANKDITRYIEMERKDPTVKACVELKSLRLTQMLGKYCHKNTEIETWGQTTLNQIRGSFAHKIGRLGSAMPLGSSFAEIVFTDEIPGHRGQWRLYDLVILDPTRISIEGKRGRVENYIYNDGRGCKKRIPYWKVIHVINGFTGNFDKWDFLFGDAESEAAYPYYKAKLAILAEMMAAAKNNATGVWLGQADSNETVQVTDEFGKPQYNLDGTVKTESAMITLLRQMQNIQNNSLLVTDKKNNVSNIGQSSSGESFWQSVLAILDTNIKMAYGVPKLIWDEGSGSLGVNSLGKQHKSILDSQIESVALQIRDQLIEKVMAPLLIANFGVYEDFGSFEIDPVQDQESVSIRVNNLITAISSDIIPKNNLSALNALYESLGLPPVNEEDVAAMQQQALIKTYMENQVFAGVSPLEVSLKSPPQTPEEIAQSEQ